MMTFLTGLSSSARRTAGNASASRARLILIEVALQVERRAQFSVDLDRHGHDIVADQGRIGLRPRPIDQQPVMTEQAPQLFGQMRHHRRQQGDQRLQGLTQLGRIGRTGDLFQMIRQLAQPGDDRG